MQSPAKRTDSPCSSISQTHTGKRLQDSDYVYISLRPGLIDRITQYWWLIAIFVVMGVLAAIRHNQTSKKWHRPMKFAGRQEGKQQRSGYNEF